MEKKRVLIIDDDQNVSQFARYALEFSGKYEVRVENSPRQGLQQARLFRPELILLDVNMPGMSGGDVAFEVRNDPRLRRTGILYFTAMVSEAEADTLGGRIGEIPVIPKTTSPEKLLEAVEDSIYAGV